MKFLGVFWLGLPKSSIWIIVIKNSKPSFGPLYESHSYEIVKKFLIDRTLRGLKWSVINDMAEKFQISNEIIYVM